MKHEFNNFSFDEDLRLLIRPDGNKIRLRPKATRLLEILLKRPNQLHRKEQLLSSIWGSDSHATDHDLQGLKREVVKALGQKDLLTAIPGEGYTIHISQNGLSPSPDSLKAPESNAVPLKELPVFPGLGTAAGDLFIHSFVGYGKNDYVKHVQRKVKWEPRPRHMAILSDSQKSTLTIPFKHLVKRGAERESYWSVVLALKVDPLTGNWKAVDLRNLERLVFTARATSARGLDRKPILLRVRLEDDSRDSLSSSNHQSTDWYPEMFELRREFTSFKIELNNFKWSLDAWHQNTMPIRRDRVYQIVFGQDADVPSSQGKIEIRNVVLLP